MTIKVEREALLRVLERQPSSSYSSLDSPIGDDDDYMLVDFRKPISSDDCSVDKLISCASDDEDSVFTVSTASLSDTDSDLERRVTFAEVLVTDEWTRPYTPKEEIANLYYSTEETQRFRQEYRLERKLLNELSLDQETFPVDTTDDVSDAVAATSCSLLSGRHRISRVVVLHNDKLETFFNPDDLLTQKVVPSGDDFFDNDSFWSGSITWY